MRQKHHFRRARRPRHLGQAPRPVSVAVAPRCRTATPVSNVNRREARNIHVVLSSATSLPRQNIVYANELTNALISSADSCPKHFCSFQTCWFAVMAFRLKQAAKTSKREFFAIKIGNRGKADVENPNVAGDVSTALTRRVSRAPAPE